MIKLNANKYARIKALLFVLLTIIPMLIMVRSVKTGMDVYEVKNLMGYVSIASLVLIVIIYKIKIQKELLSTDNLIEVRMRIGYWTFNSITFDKKDVMLELFQDKSKYYNGKVVTSDGYKIFEVRTPTEDRMLEAIKPFKEFLNI